MNFTSDFIYALKQNNPIDSVASGYANLKKQSRGFVCLCPFHSEKSPSCHINTAEGYFHCFGCGAGGDVITFIMKAENLSYPEAVKFPAERAGMPLPEDSRDEDTARIKSRILEINRCAARFYNKLLTKDPLGEKGRLYFKSRALTPKTIIKYGLGYAPDGWQTLRDYMRSHGYSDDELVAANLCAQSQKGNVYDMFRDRVIFPIIDLRGNVIAFGGRIIDGSGPKYLNTSDTPVFKKSRNLFSLNFAKNSDEKKLILAEGYMDVIAMNQAGFENVVATLGTALTPEQVRIIARYAAEVIISYDADGPGQAAAHRAIDLLSEAGIRTRVLKIVDAKDPDEYIKKFGAARFKKLLEKSGGAVSFELEKAKKDLDLGTTEDKAEYLRRAADILSQIKSPIERSLYISKLAEEQGVSKEAIAEQIDHIIKRKTRAGETKQWNDIRSFSDEMRTDPEAVRHPAEYKAECGIIAYLSRNPGEVSFFENNLPSDCFVSDFHRSVYEKIIKNLKENPDFDIMSLQSEFTADEMGKITAILDKSREIAINRRTAEDYADLLCSRRNSRTSELAPADMNDNDLRELVKMYRSKK